MPYTKAQIDELEILLKFNVANGQEGLKIHSTANPAVITAAQRLYKKGLITLEDGGYLTDLGHNAAEHAQALLLLLSTKDISG